VTPALCDVNHSYSPWPVQPSAGRRGRIITRRRPDGPRERHGHGPRHGGFRALQISTVAHIGHDIGDVQHFLTVRYVSVKHFRGPNEWRFQGRSPFSLCVAPFAAALTFSRSGPSLTSWRHCPESVPHSALFLAFSPQFFRPARRRAAQWSGGKVFREPCERGWKSFHAEVYRGLAHSGAPVIIAKARASWIFIKTAAP